jgi:hypothetical protein
VNTEPQNDITPDTWIGEYAFFESASPFQNMRYSFSINGESGVYTAHCYIFGYITMNEFDASVSFEKNSVDFIFKKYVGFNMSEPFKEGDTLLTLKMDKDKLKTYWGVVQPMLKENESETDCFYNATGQYSSEVDIWNKESPLLLETVLINELDKGEKGLFYLAMKMDKLVSVLDERGVCYNLTEIETEVNGYSLVFYLFDNCVSIHISQNQIDSIDIIGSIPLEAATSQAGLKLGDTYDEMVALYGNDCTVTDLADTALIVTGYHYKYDLGSYYLEIWMESGTVSAWGISA